MTPTEFTELRRWLTSRWPAGRIWGSDDVCADLFYDFADLPAGAVTTAAKNIYYDGAKHIPNPSELMSEARRIAKDTAVDEGQWAKPCVEVPGGHPWAILEERSNGERLVQCAACGQGPEWRRVKTPGERDEERSRR